MATYTPVPRDIPSAQRVAEITAVAAGDQIDMIDVLGRPAKKVQFYLTADTDVIDYKLNSLRRIQPQRTQQEKFSKADQVWGTFGKEEVKVWSEALPTFSSTGSEIIETGDGLEISSVQVDTLTLGTGSTMTIIAW